MASQHELRLIRATLLRNLDKRGRADNALNDRSVPAKIDELEKLLEIDARLWFTLSDIAFILGLERTYCSKAMRSCTGMSLTEWNRKIRIGIAKDLIRRTKAGMTEFGQAVGYANLTTFERNFRKVEGISPRRFRGDQSQNHKIRRKKHKN